MVAEFLRSFPFGKRLALTLIFVEATYILFAVQDFDLQRLPIIFDHRGSSQPKLLSPSIPRLRACFRVVRSQDSAVYAFS